jgi:hypothetical protein
MQDAAAACTESSDTAQALTAGHKRGSPEKVAALYMRKGVWKRYGKTYFPELTEVVLRLLSLHPTSAATERNWSLWGRVYTSARNALGLERAKKLIMFCFNNRFKLVSQDEFGLLLSVVEGGHADGDRLVEEVAAAASEATEAEADEEDMVEPADGGFSAQFLY